MRTLDTVAFLSLLTGIVLAQTALATITGTIADSTGAVVANAPVSVRNVDNGQGYAAASSETGSFTVSQLPIGDYDLTVKVAGFKTYTQSRFQLSVAQAMREDLTLEVGANSELVTVSAESSLLKTESSELAHNVTLSQLESLPAQQAGQTSNFAAEFGTSGGAMVNLLTKSGTNQLHGTAYDYINNEVQNAAKPYTTLPDNANEHAAPISTSMTTDSQSAVPFGFPKFTTARTRRSSSMGMSGSMKSGQSSNQIPYGSERNIPRRRVCHREKQNDQEENR